jgi:hypothetical protein
MLTCCLLAADEQQRLPCLAQHPLQSDLLCSADTDPHRDMLCIADTSHATLLMRCSSVPKPR